jgi:hypothetical protein
LLEIQIFQTTNAQAIGKVAFPGENSGGRFGLLGDIAGPVGGMTVPVMKGSGASGFGDH